MATVTFICPSCAGVMVRPVPCHRRRNCWSRGRELNPRPTDYESVALPLSYPGIPRGYERGRLDLITSVGACDRLVDQAERSAFCARGQRTKRNATSAGFEAKGFAQAPAPAPSGAMMLALSSSRIEAHRRIRPGWMQYPLGGRRSGICRHSAAGVENAAKLLLSRNRQTLSVSVQTGGHPGASFGSPAYAPLVRLGTKGTVVPALKSVTCGLAVARRSAFAHLAGNQRFDAVGCAAAAVGWPPRSQSVATRLLHFQVWKQ